MCRRGVPKVHPFTSGRFTGDNSSVLHNRPAENQLAAMVWVMVQDGGQQDSIQC